MKTNQSPAPQAPARKRRNTYRNLAIEFYARNSSSVLAITHQHWPDQPWTSQPELARILSDASDPSIASMRRYVNAPSNYSPRRIFMHRISRGMHFVVDGIYQPPKKLYLCTRFKNYENGRTNDY